MPTKKLRHVETVMQHLFVEDDGKTLRKRSSEPITVPAEDFPGYAETFEEQRKAQEKALNETEA